MKIQQAPPPPPAAPSKPPGKKEDHTVHNGIQLGHDASSVGEASGFLGELSREETLEMRSLVARETRQAAIWGEHAHPHTLLRAGAAGLNAVVAAGALWHAVELLQRPEKVDKAEGLSHLLMGAGCGLTAGHLTTGLPQLDHLAGRFLLAHGAAEIGIGGYRALHGDRMLGGLQAAHGACLIGAELVPSLALPLCLGMATLTGIQIWQHRKAHHEHRGPHL